MIWKSKKTLKVNQQMLASFFWSSFAIILCAVHSSVAARCFELGLCDDLIYNCKCGVPPNDLIFQLKFKQCSYFYRWKSYCEPSSKQVPGEECAKYIRCQECRVDYTGCVSCPKGKYGLWCNGDCNCKNGGICNSNDGGCNCPPAFTGLACEKRQLCDPPEEVAGLIWDGESRNMGDIIVARCKTGYSLIGPKTRTCSADGSWVPKSPICEPLCLFPTLGPHLKSDINPGMSNKTFDADNKEIIKEIQFRCNTGYALVGPHRLQCQADGKWDLEPPKCQVLKVCEDPGTPSKGNRVVVDAIDGALVPGTAIKFQCNQGHFLSGPEIITCVSSGNWSDVLPQCPRVSGCPPPDVLDNGNVEITKPVPVPLPIRNVKPVVFLKGFMDTRTTTPSLDVPLGYSNADSRAFYSCKSIYYKLDGPKTRVCMPNGVWSGKHPICKAICGQSDENKKPTIINGTSSVLGKWPWQVAIFSPIDRQNDTTWILSCGGSLVNENWVVTAAHCVSEMGITKALDTNLFRIYLGKHFTPTSLDDPEVKVFAVKQSIIHPNYDPKSLDSDIALIELMSSVTFTTRIQPVCLPQLKGLTPIAALHDDLPEGTGIVTGWGITETDLPATVLQETKLGIVNRSHCEEEYHLQDMPISVTSNMFCAGWEQGGTGICRGDSGSPFVVEELSEESVHGQIKTRWVLSGIISWAGRAAKCAGARQYAGLLKVANFVPWIEQYI